MKKEITTIEDIHLLVDTFCDKVKTDPLIGPVFAGVTGDRWPAHLRKMYRFWETVLLERYTYYGSLFGPHIRLALERAHFERWQQLFNETVDEHFSGERAEKAKWQGKRLAEMCHSKIEYARNNPA